MTFYQSLYLLIRSTIYEMHYDPSLSPESQLNLNDLCKEKETDVLYSEGNR